jgi:hypothetical protein
MLTKAEIYQSKSALNYLEKARKVSYFEMDMSGKEIKQALFNIGQENCVIIKGVDNNVTDKLREKCKLPPSSHYSSSS